MKTIKHSVILLSICLFAFSGQAQKAEVISKAEVGDFDSKGSLLKGSTFLHFDIDTDQPMVSIGNEAVIILWEPENVDDDEVAIEKFSLPVKSEWRSVYEYDDAKFLDLIVFGDHVIVLRSQYEKKPVEGHKAIAMHYDLETGELVNEEVLASVEGEEDGREFFFQKSEDTGHFMLYHYDSDDPGEDITVNSDVIHRNFDVKGRAIKDLNKVRYFIFDENLQKIHQGKQEVSLNDDEYHLGLFFDEVQNVYGLEYNKDQELITAIKTTPGGKHTSLSHKPFPKIWDKLSYHFRSQLPPAIHNGNIYLASTKYQKGLGNLQEINVWKFDFDNQKIEETVSFKPDRSFVTEINRNRSKSNLTDEKTLDSYFIDHLYVLDNEEVILLIQKESVSMTYSFGNRSNMQYINEDFILFHFNKGFLTNYYHIPQMQSNNQIVYEMYTMYHRVDLDEKTKVLKIFGQETRKGEEQASPARMRPFYHEIDLMNNETREKVLLYDGREKYSFLIRHYCMFLDNNEIILMYKDGPGEDHNWLIHVKVE